jgi:hypothetical protein
MDLRDFVNEALSQIAQGTKLAAEGVHATGAIVNPAVSRGSANPSEGHFATLNNGAPVFLVEFDVAVTVTDSGEIGAGAKGGLLQVFSARVNGKAANSMETASRIRFRVPLALGVDSATATELEKQMREQKRAIDYGPSVA